MDYYARMLMISSLGKQNFFFNGSEHCAVFKFLCLNISQSNSEIKIDQINYIKSVDYIAMLDDRKREKDDLLCKDNYNIKTLVGQLGWITGQTKPDLAFEVCQLSSIVNHSKIDDILKATKHFLKAKIENLLLKFGLSRPIGNFEIVCFNDSLRGSLKSYVEWSKMP